MKKRRALIILSVILLIPAGLFAMLNSESGSRWLVHQILSALPAKTSVQKIEGNLLDRISLTAFHYQTGTETVAISHFNFAWQPSQLLRGRLKIVDFSADQIDLNITPSEKTEESAPFDWNSDLALPLQLIIENLAITRLHYQSGDTQMDLQYLKLSALTEQNHLKLSAFSLSADPFTLQADGAVTLGKQFPFVLQSHWQFASDEYGEWQTDTTVQGDVNHIKLSSLQSSPFKLDIQGDISDLPSKPKFNIRGDWQELAWPFVSTTPQVVSKQGYIEIKGSADDYQVNLAGPLAQDYLPQAKLHFAGHGSTEAIFIEALQISSSAGSFDLNGRAGWADATTFDIDAKGQDFNPGIFLPDLAGKLTFSTHVDGELKENNRTIQAEIIQLKGELRDKPVEAQGRLAISNETININKLIIRSGRNRIDADGKLDPAESNLNFNIDTPALASLWPGLAGNLKANGTIQGNWQNPLVHAQAKGNALRFDDHRIEKLSLAVDYQPDANKSSNLQLNVSHLKSGANQIDKLVLEGKGTPSKHYVNLNIDSPQAAFSTRLGGELDKQQVWQGDLQKLTLTPTTAGTWQLRNPAKIKAAKQNAGFQVSLSNTCLDQKAAFLCITADYQANNDFSAQLKAASLPTELLSPYLPDNLRINGIVNASANLSQQKGILSGSYRVDMPAHTKVLLSDETTKHELKLGEFTVEGTLKGSLITSNINLALAGRDYLHTQLTLNTDSSGALAGRVDASITEWTLLQAFIPTAPDIKGRLTADLTLHGSMTTPRVAGNLNLNDAAITLTEAGLALKEIDIQLLSLKGPSNHIQLTGAFSPQFVPKPDADYQRTFDGRLNFNADLRQEKSLWLGSYRLDIPANSSVKLKTPGTEVSLPFAASSLAGEIEGELIKARLNLELLNHDYLRADLKIDAGRSEKLSGQASASIHDLGVFDALTPNVSEMHGKISADVSVAGTMSQPNSTGSIDLTQASLNVTKLGISVHDVDVHVMSNQERDGYLQISGNAKSGDGILQVQGFSNISDDTEIELQGNDFEVARLPEAQVAVSPNLKLKLTKTGGNLKGRIDIPEAKIELQELPQNAVVVSEDEVILGQPKPKPESIAELQIDTDIDIELGKQVSFSGLGLNTNLVGRLNMVNADEQTRLHGEINMEKGHYKSYGQDLKIRKGRFIFNGPVDAPWIDVEATRLSKDGDVTAILSVSGPSKAPKTRIYSEPSLPESEALSYLITGSPLNQIGKSEGNMVAGAALSYGAGQLSWLTEKLGIDEFEVKEGKTLQDTLVAVGQYLTPDFYVGTKVGIFNNQAVLVLKHKLTKSFTVESQSGTSQRINLNYEVDTD